MKRTRALTSLVPGSRGGPCFLARQGDHYFLARRRFLVRQRVPFCRVAFVRQLFELPLPSELLLIVLAAEAVLALHISAHTPPTRKRSKRRVSNEAARPMIIGNREGPFPLR
jgi:hypothetical protein